MAENTTSVPAANPGCIREAVCIHTSKIFDSCKDKDCIEDLLVMPTQGSQAIIDSAFSIRPRSARLLCADVRVEELSFNRGCYAVDVTYFYKVTGVAFPGERTVTGLAIFEKRAILFGSEGSAKVFSSKDDNCCRGNRNMPVAVVEAVDPIPLSMKIIDEKHHHCCDSGTRIIPDYIADSFEDELVIGRACKQLLVTLGQFSIIRLERDTQLLIPVYDYCLPEKDCIGSEDDPCTLFSCIPFPVDDFFPPSDGSNSCGCAAETC